MAMNYIRAQLLPYNWISPTCDQCNNLLVISSINAERRKPFVLICSHTCCDQCLLRLYMCKVCGILINSRFDSYHTNFFAIALLNQAAYVKRNERGIPIQMQKEMTKYCIQCNEDSDNSKEFYFLGCPKNPTDMVTTKKMCGPSKLNNCFVHLANPLIFYCKACEILSCISCNKTLHDKHKIIKTTEQNKNYHVALPTKIQSFKDVLQKNEVIQKKLESNSVKFEKSSTDAINKVSKLFIALHGHLQNLEINYIKKIRQEYIIRGHLNSVVLKKLYENNNSIENLLTELNEYEDNLPSTEDVGQKFKDFNKVLNLIEETNIDYGLDDDTEKIINFEFNGLMENQIEENIHFDVEHINKNLFLNQFKYFDDKLFKKYVGVIEKKAPPPTINTGINKIVSDTNKMTLSGSYKTEKVYVTCVKSPIQFFVQNEAEKMNAEYISKLCFSEISKKTISPNIIEEGSIYIVNHYNVFYRCKILNIVTKETYQVFLIDYGNECEFHQSKIFNISTELESHPHIARCCRLYNLKMKNITEFIDLPTQMFKDIVTDKPVTMVIFQEGNPLQVDLLSQNHGILTSVRESLIFTGHALVANADQTINTLKLKAIKDKLIVCCENAIQKNIQPCGFMFSVRMIYLFSPNKFYCRKVETEELYKKFKNDINDYYTTSDITGMRIYAPKVGMVCAVFAFNSLWHRGKILSLKSEGYCEVRLIDIGIIEIVDWKNMRILNEKFTTLQEGVFCCSLKGIIPFIENNYEWPEETIKKMFKLTSNRKLRVYIETVNTKNNFHDVLLYLEESNDEKCINIWLIDSKLSNSDLNVDELKYTNARFYTEEKKILERRAYVNTEEIEKTKETNKQVKIRILHIESPSEFFIGLKKYEQYFYKIHEDIQNQMTKRENIIHRDFWENNEKCLVQTQLKSNQEEEWYRATIISYIDGKYRIFLRDRGIKINISNNQKLSETRESLNNYCDGAIKCHLSFLIPPGGSLKWPSISTDEFKDYTEKQLIVSLQGKRDDSFSVILWYLASSSMSALEPIINMWTNINQELVDKGLAHLTEKFNIKHDVNSVENNVVTNKEFGNISKSFETESKTDFHLPPINIDNNEVVSWLPAEPILKMQFVAIPTYVAEDCTIYLHHTSQSDFLKQMNNSINEKYKNTLPTEYKWKKGQPCMVKYYINNRFYRGTIIDVTNVLFNVEFIDYGNIEDCHLNDLRKADMFGNIPIQATQYCLAKLSSLYKCVSSKMIFQYIHSKIVEKTCSVRIDNLSNLEEKIIPCSITVDTMDIIETIKLNKNIDKTISVKKLDATFPYDVVSNNCADSTSSTSNDNTSSSSSELLESNDVKFSSIGYDFNKYDTQLLVDSDISFNIDDIETSSRISSVHIDKFPSIELESNCEGFYCEAARIADSLNLQLYPHITQHQENQSTLAKEAQIAGKELNPLSTIHQGMFCLAKYNDGLWYRGFVKNYNKHLDAGIVFFIDYLHNEYIFVDDIKYFPSKFFNYPLRNLKVKLNGVEKNSKLRESAAEFKLCELIEGEKMYAKIISKDVTLKVELYTNEHCHELIYESMIKEKYFKKK